MDKRLILAVAGSGKTNYLIEQLDLKRRFIIITFTNNNLRNIKLRVIQKFNFLPENIIIFTYFTFLYSFCFKPFLSTRLQVKGINFEPCKNRFAKGDDRYIDSFHRVYSNRLAKLIEVKEAIPDIKDRLEKYFDVIMIDEIQDFSGHDFNFLPHIAATNKDIIFVGDFFQHTFDTSVDGSANKNLHKNYDAYVKRFKSMGVQIDSKTLSNSYRCSSTVCNYIVSNLDIQIASHRTDNTNIFTVNCEKELERLFENDRIVKLFYQSSSQYPCYSNNWGNSKGQDCYNDVCVVLNKKTFEHFSNKTLVQLTPQTKNKLYVAITRTKGDLFFVEEKALKKSQKTPRS